MNYDIGLTKGSIYGLGKADIIVRGNVNFRKFLRKSPKLTFLKTFCPDIYDKTMDRSYIKNCARTFSIKCLFAITSMVLELRDDTLSKLL